MRILIDDNLMALSAQEVERAIMSLPPQRRETALRYKFDLGRRQCLLSFLLLKRLLHEEFGIEEVPEFEFGEHGKPTLKGLPHIHFNISHCREAVACAVHDAPVGIDIESIREAKESVVKYSMNEQEVRQICQSPHPNREFIRLWTQKEAVSKLSGTGISDSIKDILVETDCDLQTVVTERYIYSIATGRR